MVQKPIRVLHVLGYFDRGGAESMVMNLYRSIDRNKVQFGFVVHGDRIGAFEDEVRQMGADIFRVPDYTGINHIQYKKAWRDIFSNHPEYSVVHGHVRSTANIYLNMAKRFDLKTIAHSHSTSSGSGLAAQVKNIFQYGIRQHADEFIACSTDAGQWLFGEKICNSNHFHILNNAIDTQDYIFDPEIRKKIRRELHASDKFLIGHVGRFHEAKNHSYLIDIFYECLKVQDGAKHSEAFGSVAKHELGSEGHRDHEERRQEQSPEQSTPREREGNRRQRGLGAASPAASTSAGAAHSGHRVHTPQWRSSTSGQRLTTAPPRSHPR